MLKRPMGFLARLTAGPHGGDRSGNPLLHGLFGQTEPFLGETDPAADQAAEGLLAGLGGTEASKALDAASSKRRRGTRVRCLALVELGGKASGREGLIVLLVMLPA